MKIIQANAAVNPWWVPVNIARSARKRTSGRGLIQLLTCGLMRSGRPRFEFQIFMPNEGFSKMWISKPSEERIL